MAGEPGKKKIERGLRFKFDNSGGAPQDLSGDLIPGSLSGGGKVLDEVDMTGVSTAIRNFYGGHANAPISARFHMNDLATTGAFTVLSGMYGAVGTLTIEYGSNGAAPSTGDPKWEGEYVLLGLPTAPDGGKMVLEATFQPGSATSPAWGTVA